MNPFRKKKEVDQANLDMLREQHALLQKYAEDAQTPAGQNLISVLEASINDTINEMVYKKIDDFDSNKLFFFLASCRSKLQTLMNQKNLYINAEKNKQQISEEIKRLLTEVNPKGKE